MWLDCRELGMDDAALETFFIERCGLGLNAGTEFGAGGSGFMRLNIGSPRARIMEALQSIDHELKERSS
jgi:cystathionine beta-lyase